MTRQTTMEDIAENQKLRRELASEKLDHLLTLFLLIISGAMLLIFNVQKDADLEMCQRIEPQTIQQPSEKK